MAPRISFALHRQIESAFLLVSWGFEPRFGISADRLIIFDMTELKMIQARTPFSHLGKNRNRFLFVQAFPETYAFGVQSLLDFVAAMSLLPDLISLTLPANFDDVHFLSPLAIARVSFAAMYGGRLVKACIPPNSPVIAILQSPFNHRAQRNNFALNLVS